MDDIPTCNTHRVLFNDRHPNHEEDDRSCNCQLTHGVVLRPRARSSAVPKQYDELLKHFVRHGHELLLPPLRVSLLACRRHARVAAPGNSSKGEATAKCTGQKNCYQIGNTAVPVMKMEAIEKHRLNTKGL